MTIRDALCSRANAGLINQGNHTYDNMLLVYMTKEPAVEEYARAQKINFRGVCEAPFAQYGNDDMAFVFEEDGEVKWFHISRYLWDSFLVRYFGRERADHIINTLF